MLGREVKALDKMKGTFDYREEAEEAWWGVSGEVYLKTGAQARKDMFVLAFTLGAKAMLRFVQEVT